LSSELFDGLIPLIYRQESLVVTGEMDARRAIHGSLTVDNHRLIGQPIVNGPFCSVFEKNKETGQLVVGGPPNSGTRIRITGTSVTIGKSFVSPRLQPDVRPSTYRFLGHLL